MTRRLCRNGWKFANFLPGFRCITEKRDARRLQVPGLLLLLLPLPPPPPPPPPPPLPPPAPRDPPEDAREDPAAAGPEDKPPPPPPKGNPWTKKLPQHLSTVGTGVPSPAQDSPEAGECGPREVFGS